MTNITELYLKVLVPDDKVVKQATKDLLDIYQDSNSIFQVLEILKTSTNPSVRRQAAIGLKTILHNFWYEYSDSSSAEDILDGIITSLKDETETFIQHLIIYALEPICSYRESDWPRIIDDLALECIQSENQKELDVGLSLYEIIIPFLDEDTINEILEPLSEKISFVFQNQNDLIPTSANLIASLTQVFEPPIPGCLEDLVTLLFDAFKELLLNQYPLIHKIADNLSRIVSNESVSASYRHLKFLLEIADDESIPQEFLYHIFTPIYPIIEDKYMKPTIYQLVPDLLSVVFKCSSLSFQDDCITEQSDSAYIFNSLDSILKYKDEDGTELFSHFSTFISDESVEQSFSSLLVFQFFIDNYPHIITDNLQQAITFIIQQSDVSNHHCLCELSMICLCHLIKVVNGGLFQHTDEILEAIMNSISNDHEQLVIEGLTALAELFQNLEFNHSLIPTILEALIDMIRKSPEMMNGCFYALNGLIFAAGSEIGPFSDQLAPIFLEMIQTGEKLYPISKSNATESIAQLIKNAPTEMQEFSEETMEILTKQLSSSEDLSDLNDLLSAFSILINSEAPNLGEALEIAIEKSIFILQQEFLDLGNSGIPGKNEEEDQNEVEDDDDEKPLPIEYEAKKTALNFINSLVVVMPDPFSSNLDEFIDLVVSHINDCYEPETRTAAVKAITSFCIAKFMDPANLLKEFLEMELLEDDHQLTVEQCLKSARKILLPEVPPELVILYIQAAMKGLCNNLRNRLQCQESDKFDEYEFDHSAMKFLSKVAQTHTAIYPVNSLMKLYEKRTKKNESIEFVPMAVYSLAQYLIAIKKQGLEESPKTEEILHLIFNSLSTCDGTVLPLPLLAVKELFKEGVFDLSEAFIEPTFQALSDICQIENEGQPSYNVTMAAAASLLFVLFNLMNEDFDADAYLKFMVSTLPANFKHYSDDIFSSLAQLFVKCPQLFDQFLPQIIAALAQALSLPNSTLIMAGVSTETVNKLIGLFNSIGSNHPEINQVVEETLSNQAEIDRLTQRVNQ